MSSDIALPIGPRPGGDEDPDVILRTGTRHPVSSEPPAGAVLCERWADDRRVYTATEAAHGFTLRFHQACDVTIDADLTTVEWHADPGFDEDLMPILIVGTVAAFLLNIRGRTVLHGALVRRDDAIIGIAGPSGAGKSTLAALCCAAGASLISDDVVALRLNGTPIVVGGWPELRIRPEVAAVIDAFASPPRVRTTPDGRLALQPNATDGAGTLEALVFPRPAPPDGASPIMRLAPKDALLALLAADRVQGWCRPDWQARQFTSLADLANTTPCYQVEVRWDGPLRPDVAGAVLDAVVGGRVSL